MACLTFIIIAAFVLIAYFSGDRDLLSPWFLLCLAIFACFTIVLLNYNNWDVKINGVFVIYLSTAIFAFGFGGLIIKLLHPQVYSSNNTLIKVSVDDSGIKRKYPVNLFILISFICATLYIWKLLSDAGEVSSFSGKIRFIYDKVVNDNYSPGALYNQMLEIVVAIAYVNTYRLMLRITSRKDKLSYIRLIIPIILFIVTVLVSSDRNIFIRYAIYFVFLYVLFFRENYKKKNANAKIVQKVIILVIVMVLVFFLLGKAKQYTSNIVNSISIYAGSGLYDFNLWIQDFNGPNLNGASTFSVFLNTLQTLFNRIGLSFDIVEVNRIDPFITYTSSNGYVFSSNIYTALKPYVEDFGYFGVILFPLIMGAFYQWLFIKMKRSKYGFAWVAYCMLIYPIIFFPILEQLFRRFHLGFIYELVWLAIFFYFVYGRRKSKKGHNSKSEIKEVQNV